MLNWRNLEFSAHAPPAVIDSRYNALQGDSPTNFCHKMLKKSPRLSESPHKNCLTKPQRAQRNLKNPQMEQIAADCSSIPI